MLQADEEDDAMDQQMKSPFGSSFRTFDATDYKPISRRHFLRVVGMSVCVSEPQQPFSCFSHGGREEEHLRPVHRHQRLLPGCHRGTSGPQLRSWFTLRSGPSRWRAALASCLEPGHGEPGHGVSPVRGGTAETGRRGRRRRSGETPEQDVCVWLLCVTPCDWLMFCFCRMMKTRMMMMIPQTQMTTTMTTMKIWTQTSS